MFFNTVTNDAISNNKLKSTKLTFSFSLELTSPQNASQKEETIARS